MVPVPAMPGGAVGGAGDLPPAASMPGGGGAATPTVGFRGLLHALALEVAAAAVGDADGDGLVCATVSAMVRYETTGVVSRMQQWQVRYRPNYVPTGAQRRGARRKRRRKPERAAAMPSLYKSKRIPRQQSTPCDASETRSLLTVTGVGSLRAAGAVATNKLK